MENPVTTLRTEARSVVVDVVVADKNGKAVSGLTQQDFQIFEDGKPQTITFFEQHTVAGTREGPGEALTSLPPGTFTNFPAGPPTDSHNVLLLDALNTSLKDQSFVQREVARYLSTATPRAPIAIFQLSDRLRILQDFAGSSRLPSLSIPRTSGVDKSKQRAYNDRTAITLDALQQIGRYLAGIPSRKNLIWFSGDIPLLLSASAEGNAASESTSNPNGDSPYYEASKKTVDFLANADISVYPIEATGLAPDALDDASISNQDNRQRNAKTLQPAILQADAKLRNIRHLTMDQLAEDTGAKSSYNQNDLTSAIAQDIDHGSRYYTIAYTPTNRSEKGKERKIEVRLVPGTSVPAKYDLAYRRHYFEDGPNDANASATAGKDPLRPLMEHGMPESSELRFQAHIVPQESQPASRAPRAGDNRDLKPPFTRYSVDVNLSIDNISLAVGEDGIRQGKIEVALIAFGSDRKPLNWVVHLVALVVRPEQYATAQKSGIPFHLEIDAPPGDVSLRTGVYDTSSGKAGTLEIPLSAVAKAGT